MEWKVVLGAFFSLIAIALLIFYWFIPNNAEFFLGSPSSSNFTLDNSTEMQFYSNMRFPNSTISYKINQDCSLQKKNDMKRAFQIISQDTILEFYPINSNEEISVTCDEKNKIEGGMFIAGEGGPTKIISGEKFDVIFHGNILLIRDVKCERPNVAIHELLHVLGFNHSSNPNNIMYPVTKCSQVIGEDTLQLLNEIYSYPSQPDLSFENVHAKIEKRYLDINMSIRNNGLKKSENANVKIYLDDDFLKEVNLESIGIGEGITLSLSNVFVSKINIRELNLIIESDFEELEKENNKIKLKMKK